MKKLLPITGSPIILIFEAQATLHSFKGRCRRMRKVNMGSEKFAILANI